MFFPFKGLPVFIQLGLTTSSIAAAVTDQSETDA